MTEIIEANFSQIKEIMQENKEDLIKAITQEKNKEIAELKNELRAKEEKMLSLKLKEGELKGKDEVIASLNLRINEF